MGWAVPGRIARGLLAATLGATVLAVAPAPPAEAAGITTHAWMAMEAVELVDDPQLRDLLRANIEQVRAGATFPDGGYVPGNVHGEEAHWQRFMDAYADRILARSDCGDLTDPHGPCAPVVAHLMGVVGHSIGDQTWDWLFEPNSPDLGEYYLPPEWSAFTSPGGQELQLDVVAVADHGRPTHPVPAVPSPEDVLGAFDDVGFVGATPQALELGTAFASLVGQVEAMWAPQHIDALRTAMPWMSANFVTAPGGVLFTAVAIAGAMQAMWGRLLGDQPPTEVSITYPADGQRGIPATGWVRDRIWPGSNPGTGGARTRITAALTYSRPYVPRADQPGSIPAELPPGAMTLEVAGTGEPVPILAGWPRSVPYDPNPGHHLVDIQPAVDLQPCTWYVVRVTEALVDARGEPVVPHSWRFRTGIGPDGAPCPDEAAVPRIVPGMGSAMEGDAGSTLRIPVTLTQPTGHAVTARWTAIHVPDLAEPQAAAGTDYTTTTGSITFLPGQTEATIPIELLDDTTAEPTELVVVAVHSPANAAMGGFWGLGIGYVYDDEVTGPVVVPGVGSVVEGDEGTRTLRIPLLLTEPTAGPVLARCLTLIPPDRSDAAGPEDYAVWSEPREVSLAPGRTVAHVEVEVRGDRVREPAELVVVICGVVEGARIGGFWGLGVGYVVGDD